LQAKIVKFELGFVKCTKL